MRTAEQIKALAELDGFAQYEGSMEYDGEKMPFKLFIDNSGEKYNSTDARFKYLTSYDAIIPLIQKLDLHSEVLDGLTDTERDGCYSEATPAQLCKALLRATGKWKE